MSLIFTGLFNWKDNLDGLGAQFPFRKGIWLHGSPELGLEYVKSEIRNPVNFTDEVRRTLLALETEYVTAVAADRRVISRSDPTSDKDIPFDKIDRLAGKIYGLEIYLEAQQRYSNVESERLNISHDLKVALVSASELDLLAHYGDYLAIINHEVKADPHLDGLAFKDDVIKSTIHLVQEFDNEIKAKETDQSAPSPYIDSISKAMTFLNTMFKSEQDVMMCFRRYAERNTTFHSGVKELAENSLFGQLWQCLVRDRIRLKFMEHISEKSREDFNVVLEAVAAKFYADIDWDIPGEFMLSEYGNVKQQNRRAANRAAKANEKNKSEKVRDEEELVQKFESIKVIEDLALEKRRRTRKYENWSRLSETLDGATATTASEEISILQRQHEELIEELQRVRHQLTKTTNNALQLSETIKAYKEAEKKQREVMEDCEMDLKDAKEEAETMEEQIKELENGIQVAQTEATELKDRLLVSDTRVDELEKEVARLTLLAQRVQGSD